MFDPQLAKFKPQINAAHKILTERFNTSLTIFRVENLSPDRDWSIALRLHLASSRRDTPRQVVLKHTAKDGASPYDPSGSPIHRLIDDYAGCKFLSAIENTPPLSPLAYGFDYETAMMLIEDIPNDDQSLVQPLLEGNPTTAESALTQMMTRLGQLHAKTIGKADEYAALRDGIELRSGSSRAMMVAMYRSLGNEKLQEIFNIFGYTPSHEVWTEFETILTVIEHPGSFLAYVHGDPCPDNLLFSDGQLRIIDFEQGGFGHCLIDAVYPRFMFPSCWCANMIPMDVVERLESRYRDELATMCPEATDEVLFRRGLADAGGFWLIFTIILKLIESDTPYDDDYRWGISTHHRRIIGRLKRFAETAEQANAYPALQQMCHDLYDLLGERWEYATEGLPIYPAFRNEDGLGQ